MMGSVVGCVQVVRVWFLAMSGISELWHCMPGSVVGCVQLQVVGVWLLARSGISELYQLVSVVVCSVFFWGSGLTSQNFVYWAVL